MIKEERKYCPFYRNQRDDPGLCTETEKPSGRIRDCAEDLGEECFMEERSEDKA